ncbi:phenylalanine--tRNA ligase subunit alpha [bacterium]|jgi:phenylalanyl-tRNA synthetase alpha chain|nr:phenylalanine--tRNA ligase subunit alpha [bacterium]MBT4251211.1 phenylalanine--tRNA ligase subunit alpha [bacterium]MBT4597997.1 phenylalanine--tRNA ligase subunit alpha [bacterium]MBT6753590.1 phenylalanine--tRNA ligase subunit alpha [bacterium]MBT7037705.1 phenylalanine--tRNA ligase subunit alpha [bacterium]
MQKETIEKLRETATGELEKANSLNSLEELRVKYLGRKSEFIGILRGLKDLSVEDKKVIGPLANQAKIEIESGIQTKITFIEQQENDAKEWIDVTLPGEKERVGSMHVISQIQKEIEDIFISMGFEIGDGPEIETEWYNFTALNVPADHPARDMQDTFWLKQSQKNENNKEEKILPRTQLSPDQIHYMQSHTPPFRVIVPGRVYRNESTDATHEHTFHQFEALVVGEDISVANFKSIAQTFFSKFFGKELEIRLRPGYFPFTEPSFEFDISCTVCGGQGCRSCKNTGWLEVGGCGMVNQRVFENAGYERNKWQGFAWGFGMERLAMMKYKVDDIRLFMSGDLRFLRQFK